MGEKASWFPLTKIVQLTQAPDASGEVAFDIKVDLYSDGKEDWRASGELNKFKFPVEPIGGQDLPGERALGTTFFLNYGWRIRPYELTHVFNVDGNLYTDTGASPFAPTVGNYNVSVIQQVSSLVDVVSPEGTDAGSIADAVMDELLVDHQIEGSLSDGVKYRTFNNRVCIDPVNGSPGTLYPLGTAPHPSSNLADAKEIADDWNIREFQLFNHLVIGASDNINDYIFQAEQDIDVVITMVAGCTTQNSRFHHLILQGAFNGKSHIEHSTTLEIFNYSGFIIDTIFMDNIAVVNPAVPSLFSMCGGGKVSPVVEVDLNDSNLNVGGWKGPAKLVGKTGSGTNIIEFMSGSVIIDSTCVAGTIILKGLGRVVEDNSGPGCTVNTDGLIFNSIIRVLGLVQENYYLDNTVYTTYNGTKLLTSGRIRLYSIPASVGTASDIIDTYIITATWTDDELDDYKMVRQ